MTSVRATTPGTEDATGVNRPNERSAWRRIRRHRLALISGGMLAVLALACLSAPIIEQLSGHDSTRVNLFARQSAPSPAHWLGTDELGRDLALRLLYGGQVSLAVGLAGAAMAAGLGTFIGLIAGYIGGRTDAFLMRFTDGMIALPLLPLLIVLAAVDLHKAGVPSALADSESVSLYRIIAIVALFGWTTAARLVRAATLKVRESEYVLASITAGAGPFTVMYVHILPNVVSPLIVATTLSVGNVILLESVLSFLGLGIQPPLPSWGNMLSNAQDLIHSAPRLALFPGALIFFTVLTINLLGDAIADALNPRNAART
ncbi:MAG: peptide/nickel transport system permease protein [Gammaproteobacteria bacterium]